MPHHQYTWFALSLRSSKPHALQLCPAPVRTKAQQPSYNTLLSSHHWHHLLVPFARAITLLHEPITHLQAPLALLDPTHTLKLTTPVTFNNWGHFNKIPRISGKSQQNFTCVPHLTHEHRKISTPANSRRFTQYTRGICWIDPSRSSNEDGSELLSWDAIKGPATVSKEGGYKNYGEGRSWES